MVLQRSNFEIPARFTFQPYSAEWRLVTAETLEWAEEQKLRMMAFVPAKENPEKNWLRVGIGVPLYGGLDSLYGIDNSPSYAVLMSRSSIPPDVLPAHEDYRNTPDIAGRQFQVLICREPEFIEGIWAMKPGDVTKNAWIMRDEFLSLEADPELGWNWSARRFLNKWGLWGFDKGYVEIWNHAGLYPNLAALAGLGTKQRMDKPDFVMVVPHLLKEHQEWYRKALLPTNAINWLRLHPPHLESAKEFPFFRVHKSYCSDAIEATITIDHLAKRQFGICKRCHRVFERETKHKKNYCSERCFNAAGVQRWREKQRKAAKKGAKRNAKG